MDRYGWASSDPFEAPDLLNLAGLGGMYAMKAAPKVDAYGEPVGVTPRLFKVGLYISLIRNPDA